MLIEHIIKHTVDLQGFLVHTVRKELEGFVAEIVADKRYFSRCGACGTAAESRDSRPVRFFRHVPLWNMPVWLKYSPRRIKFRGHDQ